MQGSVRDFVAKTLSADNVAGRRVLEVGACDVNGTVRPYVEALGPAEYVGVDLEAGPGVDRIANCEQLVAEVGGNWDVVVSTEMLEHVTDWRRCMHQLVAVLSPGGLLVVTTRSPGFFYHPHPVDNWRFTIADMAKITEVLGLMDIRIENDPEACGVFVSARRLVRGWQVSPHDLDGITVKRADPGVGYGAFAGVIATDTPIRSFGLGDTLHPCRNSS